MIKKITENDIEIIYENIFGKNTVKSDGFRASDAATIVLASEQRKLAL